MSMSFAILACGGGAVIFVLFGLIVVFLVQEKNNPHNPQ